MSILCLHVHRVELRNFLKLCVARLPVKRKIKERNKQISDKWGFWHTCYVATATQNLNYYISSLWVCSHIMDIIKKRKYNFDF